MLCSYQRIAGKRAPTVICDYAGERAPTAVCDYAGERAYGDWRLCCGSELAREEAGTDDENVVLVPIPHGHAERRPAAPVQVNRGGDRGNS